MGLDTSPSLRADFPCCPLTLSELGICLQASLERVTSCSLLQDSGPGPQKGASYTSHF